MQQIYSSSIFEKHIFDIPKKWLTVSQPVREWNWCKWCEHKLIVFQKIELNFFISNNLVIVYL